MPDFDAHDVRELIIALAIIAGAVIVWLGWRDVRNKINELRRLYLATLRAVRQTGSKVILVDHRRPDEVTVTVLPINEVPADILPVTDDLSMASDDEEVIQENTHFG